MILIALAGFSLSAGCSPPPAHEKESGPQDSAGPAPIEIRLPENIPAESPANAAPGMTIEPKRIGTFMGGGLGLYAPLDVWRKEIEHAKKLNIGIVRFNSDVWDMLEPERGKYRWEKLDQLVNLLVDEAGIEVLFTLPISSKWNGQNRQARAFGFDVGPTHFPTEDMESYRNFCGTLAARYKGKIKYYEIWNEPDFPMFWKGDLQPDAAEYLPFLKQGYEAIKQADPDAVVLNGGLAKPQETLWLKKLLKLGGGDYFDALNIHIYPAFARYPDALDVAQRILAAHKLQKPVWVTETSTTGAYFETADRVEEEYQKSVYLAQNYTRALSRPEVSRIFWHSLKNPGKDVRLPKDYDFGLISSGGETLPAYEAHRVWSQLLVGCKPLGRMNTTGDVEIYEFERDGSRLLVGWSRGGKAKFAIPEKYKRAKITTLGGKSRSAERTQQPEVILGKEPVYVELFPG